MKGSTKGKDPAVSWVFNDWQGGTMTLSRFLKGCYMDLLTAQFNNGHLSLDEVKTVLGSDFGASWPALQKKFAKDANGLLYNERLEFEIVKRKKYNKSRRDNLHNEEDLSSHMGNGNGNENEIDNENLLNVRKKKFELKMQEMLNSSGKSFDISIVYEFLDYWTEHSDGGKKMRFEKQEVFDIKRRWNKWLENHFKFKKENGTKESGIAAIKKF